MRKLRHFSSIIPFMKHLLLTLLLCSSVSAPLLAQRRIYLQSGSKPATSKQLTVTSPRDTAFVRITKGGEDMGAVSPDSYAPRLDVPDGMYEFYVDKQLKSRTFVRAGAPDSIWVYYNPGGDVSSTTDYRRAVVEEWSYEAGTGRSFRTWRYKDIVSFSVQYYGREGNLPAGYSWSSGQGPEMTVLRFSIESDGLLSDREIQSGAWNALLDDKIHMKRGKLQGRSSCTFARQQVEMQFEDGRLTGWRMVDTKSNAELAKWGSPVKSE